jgi:hypothetical protein
MHTNVHLRNNITALKNLLLITSILLIFSSLATAQKTYTISGYVQDSLSSEKLIGAIVVDRLSGAGIATNSYGFYSLTIPEGKVELVVSYVGYNRTEMDFVLDKNKEILLRLGELSSLNTVVITDKFDKRIEQQVQMSRVTIPIEQIKKIPALLGETDVLKALQLLPGVQSGGEGQNGLYVRGGSPDQNLILLDGVPVYNVSHLGGFFSVFNGDAIKHVSLTKGGFPARYGGRLSSVIEIDMKEGDMQKFHGEGAIGLITSRVTLEGPILRDKMSFMVSARRTYVDVLAKPIINTLISNQNNADPNYSTSLGFDAYFYDLNAKVNYKINEKHRLFLSAFTGNDVFGINYKSYETATPTNFNSTAAGTTWGNIIGALRWNWTISPKLFLNTTATFTEYKFNLTASNESNTQTFNWNRTGDSTIYSFNSLGSTSGIKDWTYKMDFNYLPNPKHNIRFGAGVTAHTYNPGTFQVQLKSAVVNIDTALGAVTKSYSTEPYLYVEDEINLGALRANIGLHASGLAVDGTFYKSIQPRLGLNYLVNNTIACKASFSSMTQYINLLTNEGVGLPTDLWVPSTAKIKPQESWQIAAGIAKTVNNTYEFSAEVYYKSMNNVISYKEDANFFGIQNNWENKVTQGTGKAYGLELFLQKKEGRTTGWIGYTLSWNKRQFSDLNNGLEYDFKYDRRHDLSVVFSHKFTDKFSATAAFVYGTGNAVTLPDASYNGPNTTSVVPRALQALFNTTSYNIASEKNGYRMPVYHRLDVNLEWLKKKKKWERRWSLGAYNAYSRANPYTVLLETVNTYSGTGRNRILLSTTTAYKQLTIFPIVPFVSWGFKF